MDDQPRVGDPRPFTIGLAKFLGSRQPWGGRHAGLDRNPVTPLRLPALEHVPPPRRAHPHSEPVAFLPAPLLRLIRPLHRCVLPAKTFPTIAQARHPGAGRDVDNLRAIRASIHNFGCGILRFVVNFRGKARLQGTPLHRRRMAGPEISTGFCTPVDNAQTPYPACRWPHRHSAGTPLHSPEHWDAPQEDIHNHGYRLVACGIS